MLCPFFSNPIRRCSHKMQEGLGKGGFAFNFQFVDTLPYLRYP